VTRGGWEIVVSLRRTGWGLSAHRGSPDAWEGHPGRWATEAEARAAAEGWDPGGVAGAKRVRVERREAKQVKLFGGV
jgi:hypothetical protein